MKIFSEESIEHLRKKAVVELNISGDDVDGIFLYIAGFLCNLGNYKSFGDSKFVPRPSKEVFRQFIVNTSAVKGDSKLLQMWHHIEHNIYSLEEGVQYLGFRPSGVTTYFSSNCTKEDAELVQTFLDKNRISAYNTRLVKTATGEYIVRQAASEVGSHETLPSTVVDVNGDQHSITVERGDYRELMELMVKTLPSCESSALNENEKSMLAAYRRSYTTGSIDEHKEGSRFWIRDIGPVIETYMGFIESYRDPQGVRGEFESFVAIVNKETSRIFGNLVDNAPDLLLHLPWPRDFEKDRFLRPDFTSLEVLGFGSSGVPAGINIPNYDDIRQNEGFKNVSLQNVLSARFREPSMTFLRVEDRPAYKAYMGKSFEIQVGLHELLGHGSGKLFSVNDEGQFDFDVNVIDFLTGKPIASWYKPGETWDSVFKAVASPYEECRAECVGIYLCDLPSVLDIFGHTEAYCAGVDPAEVDVVFINWLSMARAGIIALETYNANTKAWGQAHSQARFAILQVMLEAGQDFLKIEETIAEDGQPDLVIHLDRTKIKAVGKPAVGNFLKHLQNYKSTAKSTEGTDYFLQYCQVNERFLHLKEIVFARREPRPLLVQGNTFQKADGQVEYVAYESSADGMISSYIERYMSMPEVYEAVEAIWNRDKALFDI